MRLVVDTLPRPAQEALIMSLRASGVDPGTVVGQHLTFSPQTGYLKYDSAAKTETGAWATDPTNGGQIVSRKKVKLSPFWRARLQFALETNPPEVA